MWHQLHVLFELEAEFLWSCCAHRTMPLLPEAFQDAPVTNNPAPAISIRTSKGQWQGSQSQEVNRVEWEEHFCPNTDLHVPLSNRHWTMLP